MDDDGLNMRPWGYYEASSYKANLGLQLMSNMDRTHPKSYLPGRDPSLVISPSGTFHPRDCVVSEAPIPTNYGWINQQRDRFFNMFPVAPNGYSVLSEASAPPAMQILQPPSSSSRDERIMSSRDERIMSGRVEEPTMTKESSQMKKRQGVAAPKAPKAKKARKPKDSGNANNNSSSVQRVKPAKKSIDVVINGISMDISGLPVPVCTCTGSPQQCYRWGCGGWQSACCTTNISMYPLPMSTKRRGARISGRKMSQGAFKKVLEKLAAEGYNFSNPIDLKTHWARHGTNKFVTIR